MLRGTRGLSVAKSRKMLIRDVSKDKIKEDLRESVGERPLSISPKSQLPMQRRRSMVRNKYGLASITKDRDSLSTSNLKVQRNNTRDVFRIQNVSTALSNLNIYRSPAK